MIGGLPTPPMDAEKSTARKPAKPGKPAGRTAKRANSHIAHDHSIVLDGRHKRVWKACERCRLKKTKCDGESPCKRCKDDGLLCTAGSRKKNEYKQLPKGYAEVLENTQYALIATVQKLYTMVRNNESWDLGEPELNDRGQPVIHNIAEKLGCIRPSPDLPYAFPEDADEFAELQARMQLSHGSGEGDSGRKLSHDSATSMPSRDERASSSESDHSAMSGDFGGQTQWQQLQQEPAIAQTYSPTQAPDELQFDESRLYLEANRANGSFFDARTAPSPTSFSDLTSTESPVSAFARSSPFSPWSAGDDFLGPSHMLDLTALYMRQQQFASAPTKGIPRSAPTISMTSVQRDAMSLSLGQDGTIRPNMLDCSIGYDLAAQEGAMYAADYETQMMA